MGAEIVASVYARDVGGAVASARRAAMAGADWIELRLDEWPVDERLDEVVAAIRLPILVTCRVPDDGGAFRGSLAVRRRLLEGALAAGVDGIDLEDWEAWGPEPHEVQRLIRSHHDLRGVPDDPFALRDELLGRGAHIAKIVGTVYDLADAEPLVDLLGSTDQENEPTVAFAMGDAGVATRVLGAALGAPLVYASVPGEAATAPGQLDVAQLAGVYDVRRLDAQTELYGVVGDPVRASLSPWVHNRALRARGQEAVYLPLETRRQQAVLAMLPRRRLRGVSVTSPHKGTAVRLCHRLSEEANAAGVVNTLVFEAHDLVVGHNTDIAGVRDALTRAGLEPQRGDAPAHGAVLGGGGAARAAAVALEQLGFEVTMLARTLEPVREFAAQRGYRLGTLRADVLDELRPLRAVVHATPVGGPADLDSRVLPDWTPPRGCYVLDMIYRPATTRLLEDVAAAGAVPVPGLEMFLTQAAEQLRLFVGDRPDEDELRGYVAGVGGVS